jgi:glutamate/tyrosine decarboxylase-like PLP-dependent enzyme
MSATKHLAAAIERRFGGEQDLPVAVSVTPETVQHHLRAHFDFRAPRALEEVLDDADRMLRQWTEHASHPMHFGLFRPNVDEASVLAEALVALYDPNLATWDFSPAANEIERHTLAAIAERFGTDPETSVAHFTSGGQEANHTAVIVALTHRFPELGKRGLRALHAQPVLYLSEEAHHSFEKVAHSTGLGRAALRTVPAGPDLRMDVLALREQIRADRRGGLAPFLVIGTAGTTNAGVVDPLDDIADVARDEGLWFHADGAWGGAAALSDRLRPALAGIERADSITCDAHKWISVPVGAGMVFCRHPGAVRASFEVDTPYVPEQSSARVDPYVASMQWSRRFIGLKVFLMFAARGLPEIARRIEHQADMGEYLREELRRRGWRILNPTPLPVVCFWHDDFDGHSERASKIETRLKRTREAWISKTALRGETPALRACMTNFDTRREHVDQLVALLERERAQYGSSSADAA